MCLKSLLFLLLCFNTAALTAAGADAALDNAIKGDHRDPEFVERDRYRHPKETLKFLGLKQDMTVVEIWPARGWYTEILAPVMRDHGILYEAGFAMTADRTPGWRKDMHKAFMEKLEQRPDVYDHVVVTELSVPERTTIAPPGTADMVLTFRNVHNWMKGEYAPAMFDVFYRTLKPGGILGVVEHRASPGSSLQKMIESGYVSEEHVKKLALDAGFQFEAASEINANPQDRKDHPAGVWTLPPTLRYCREMEEGPKREACFVKYTTIGESDRMTLRFRKPED
ncbi:MAG TPA: methyltransferase [Gammaproteobacteria bacterium]|nr:methyltransferase [Gammaproteobacteria bacterium]